MRLAIRKATALQDFAHCVRIRTLVFVVDQNVPPLLEIDTYEGECQHYLAVLDDVPVGTVRWRWLTPDTIKIERLAVLRQFQGQGVGHALIQEILSEMLANGRIRHIKLSAQDNAIAFYEKLGFAVYGDGYLDAEISHHDMTLSV